MKNLKYIFALSALFVSFFAFDYATNFNDPKTDVDTNKNDNNKDDNKNNDDQNSDSKNDQIKKNIINSYNSHYSSTCNLKLNKGNLVYKNFNKPINLDFSGFYSTTKNSLNSYVIDATYTYESSSESFQVNSGSINYSTITYNDKVYLFSSSNELSGILSFPSTKNTKYPNVNLDFNFSTIFNSFLKLDSDEYEVLSSSIGYTFTNKSTTIKVDSNYNLLEINSNYNDLLTLSLNFKDLYESSTTSEVIENSTDFTNTLKGLFNDRDFNITYNASIKSSMSNNLKYNGYVSYLNNSLTLNVNEYIDNNLKNDITSTFKDENIYFNISNGKEKGNLIDSEITDLVSVTSGLMSFDTQFDYSFNEPLNALLNTSPFQSILNLNLSSSYIKDLKEEDSIKTFKINSKSFNFIDDFDIRFELKVVDNTLESISIKDFKTTTTSVMDIELKINNTKSNTFNFNSKTYPVYNSFLPYYKKVIFIINDIQTGGNFTTSIIDNNSQTVLGLSTHYDVNLGKSINNISLDNLNAALSNLEINFKDCTDSNKTNNIATALFLENTTSTAKNTFDLSIKNINYKNKTFYITIEENSTQNKYTLQSESIKGLISSIQKVTASSTTQNNSTSKGFNSIKNEIDRVKELITKIQANTVIKDLIDDVKNDCNFSNIPKYIKISINNNDIKATFNLNSLLGESTIKEYGLCTGITLTLSKDEKKIVSLQTSDITFDGMSTNNSSTQTSIGFNDYKSENILDDIKINNEWVNTSENPNNSRNLNDIVDKIDDVVQIYNKAIVKNSVLQSLIDIDFIYQDKSLKGSLSTKFHFDEFTNIDDKYIEGSIPLSFENENGGANSLYGMNLEFIYSDKDKDTSKFTSLVDNSNKLTEGTQIGLSLNYGSNDSRNNSKLYAYSNHETVNSMLDSISGIGDTNTLWPYEVIRTIQNYAQSVKEVLNQNQTNVIEILKKLGINNTKGIVDLLNGLNASKNTLTARVNLGSLIEKEGENKDKLSEFNVDITLNLNIDYVDSIDENGNKTTTKNISLESIDAKSVENKDLSCKITLKSNLLEGETSATHNSSYDILPSFTPIKDSSSKNVNYIDTSNVYNLLQLGIYTTNRKYYNITGVLNFKAKGEVIGISVDAEVLNNLYFDIKLNLFKDPKPENFNNLSEDEQNNYLNTVYKIKGYLKVAINNDTNKANNYNNDFTEFFIEPGETEAEGTIYIFKANKANSVTDTITTTTDPSNFVVDTNKYLENYTYTSKDKRAALDLVEGAALTNQTFATEDLARSYYLNNYAIYREELDENSVSYPTTKVKDGLYISYGSNMKEYLYDPSGIAGYKSEQEAKEKYYKEVIQNNSYYSSYGLTVNNLHYNIREVKKFGVVWAKYYQISFNEIKIDPTYEYQIVSNITKHIDEVSETTYTYTLTHKFAYNIETYKLDKKDFIGNMELHIDSSESVSGQVPTLIYYLLDYSQIIKKDAKVKKWGVSIGLYDIVMGSICDSMKGQSSQEAKINYLSGWKITSGNNSMNIEINPGDLISGIDQISFNTGINLNFNKNTTTSTDFDSWTFNLKQTDEGKYLVSATAGSASISIGITSSQFSFISSANEEAIKDKMKRYNSFIENFKTNEYTNNFGYCTPNKIWIYNDSIAFNDVVKYSGVTFTNNDYYSGIIFDYRYFQGVD